MKIAKVVLPLLAFFVGFSLMLGLPNMIRYEYAGYLSLATLAGMDSVFGGMRAGLDNRFKSDIFLSGFIVNMLLACALAFLGDRIGVPELYLAAVVTLGGRIFVNLSVIRRQLLERRLVRDQK
jgi:small basic protein